MLIIFDSDIKVVIMSVLVFMFVLFFPSTDAHYLYLNFLTHGRPYRHCKEPSAILAAQVEDSKFSLFLIFLSALLFLLIFLGFLKGIIGLCCCGKTGMYGLNLLIDLPRPLNRYQEKHLSRRSVVYDIGGWPVHPDTLERSVRVLPKRTEFCLNLVFFLACPLAACIYVCAYCCCIRNLNQSQENTCFKHVDVVRLMECNSKNAKLHNMKKSNETTQKAAEEGMDVYKADYKEDEDTKYVIDAMQESEDSIKEYHINIRACKCHPEKEN